MAPTQNSPGQSQKEVSRRVLAFALGREEVMMKLDEVERKGRWGTRIEEKRRVWDWSASTRSDVPG